MEFQRSTIRQSPPWLRGGPFSAAALAALALLMLAAGRASAGGAIVGPPQAVSSPIYLTSIACVDSETCYAIGRQSMDSGPAEIVTLTDGKVTDQQTVSSGGSDFLEALACLPTGACYAIGSTSLSSGGSMLLPITNGVPGQAQKVDGVASLRGIACSAAGASCYAVGGSAEPGASGVIVPVMDGREGQAQPVPGTVLLWDIDCPTTHMCYALGATDFGLATLIVPVADGRALAGQPVSGGGFSAIACPSSDICYAVGYAGGPASTNRGQGTGGYVAVMDGQPGPIEIVDGAGPFSAIACPTSNTCFALGSLHAPPVGTPSGPPSAAVVPIRDGAAGDVIAADFPSLLSGDCPNSQICYAVTRNAIVPISSSGTAEAVPLPSEEAPPAD
jgi:hypothetical protein